MVDFLVWIEAVLYGDAFEEAAAAGLAAAFLEALEAAAGAGRGRAEATVFFATGLRGATAGFGVYGITSHSPGSGSVTRAPLAAASAAGVAP